VEFEIILFCWVLFQFGGTGMSQLGYRFAMDFYPLLTVLTIRGMDPPIRRWHMALIVAGVVFNAWGIWVLTHLEVGRPFLTVRREGPPTAKVKGRDAPDRPVSPCRAREALVRDCSPLAWISLRPRFRPWHRPSASGRAPSTSVTCRPCATIPVAPAVGKDPRRFLKLRVLGER
jgi:hypothetical protein